MQVVNERYGLGNRVSMPFAEAVSQAKAALQTEGFGVLCEIDVQATLKNKINVERTPYVILGACNPTLANQALSAEPDLGLLLPCNVVVYEDQGSVWVKAVDPIKLLDTTGNTSLRPIAEDVKARLERVLAQLS